MSLQNWYFSQIALTNRIYLFKGYIQIYPVSEGYLRKIPVERRGKFQEQHCTIIANLHVTRERTRIFWPFFAGDNNKW
jgi:hypothetical protein